MTASGSTGTHDSRLWRELIPRAARIQIVLLTALTVFVYWGAIRYTLVSRWISDGNWSHGWLIPLFSVYFLSTRRDAFSRVRAEPNYLGAVVLVLSLAAYFVSAWLLGMAYPTALSMVSTIFGLTLLVGGWPIARVAAFPILFLVLAIPLPQSLYVELSSGRRRTRLTVAVG